MDLVSNMNRVIDFIEDHLTSTIEKEDLSRIAMCSSYHLSRMFPFLTGVTLSEYIRRRRISMAALELSQTGITVLDVAVKYGYDSPTAFTQAFKTIHGIPPSIAKDNRASLVYYPKLSFQLSVKGDVAMNFRMVKKERFMIVGSKQQIRKIDGDEDFAKITELWANLDDEMAGKLLSLSNGYFEGLIGASANNQDDAYDYYIGVSGEADQAENMAVVEVPALDWAVFQVVGALPDAMMNVWKRIFTEWFPGSGYESVDAPCLEIYSEGDICGSDYSCELWIPVRK